VNGTSGTSGTSGVNGSSGTSGTSGANGSSGTSGTSGANGSSGTSGTSGVNGDPGEPGPPGDSGSSGTSGTSGISIQGPAGSSGTSGIDTQIEYIALNVVPQNYPLVTWENGTTYFSDAFVVIPSGMHQWNLVEITASYGTFWSGNSHTWNIICRDTNNLTFSSHTYTHPGGQRSHQTLPGIPMVVRSEYTLHVTYNSGAPFDDSEVAGLTVTLKFVP
jgi:hypothetical protein